MMDEAESRPYRRSLDGWHRIGPSIYDTVGAAVSALLSGRTRVDTIMVHCGVTWLVGQILDLTARGKQSGIVLTQQYDRFVVGELQSFPYATEG